MNSRKEPPRFTDHLANERTFLAWIRTSIALMGFGFVIVKFAVFIRQISIMLAERAPVVPKLYSGEIGVGMVIFGAIVAAMGYLNFAKTRQMIAGEEKLPPHKQNLLISLIVIAVSLALIAFLIPNIG